MTGRVEVVVLVSAVLAAGCGGGCARSEGAGGAAPGTAAGAAHGDTRAATPAAPLDGVHVAVAPAEDPRAAGALVARVEVHGARVSLAPGASLVGAEGAPVELAFGCDGGDDGAGCLELVRGAELRTPPFTVDGATATQCGRPLGAPPARPWRLLVRSCDGRATAGATLSRASPPPSLRTPSDRPTSSPPLR